MVRIWDSLKTICLIKMYYHWIWTWNQRQTLRPNYHPHPQHFSKTETYWIVSALTVARFPHHLPTSNSDLYHGWPGCVCLPMFTERGSLLWPVSGSRQLGSLGEEEEKEAQHSRWRNCHYSGGEEKEEEQGQCHWRAEQSGLCQDWKAASASCWW